MTSTGPRFFPKDWELLRAERLRFLKGRSNFLKTQLPELAEQASMLESKIKEDIPLLLKEAAQKDLDSIKLKMSLLQETLIKLLEELTSFPYARIRSQQPTNQLPAGPDPIPAGPNQLSAGPDPIPTGTNQLLSGMNQLAATE